MPGAQGGMGIPIAPADHGDVIGDPNLGTELLGRTAIPSTLRHRQIRYNSRSIKYVYIIYITLIAIHLTVMFTIHNGLYVIYIM